LKRLSFSHCMFFPALSNNLRQIRKKDVSFFKITVLKMIWWIGNHPREKLDRHVLMMAGPHEKRILGHCVTSEKSHFCLGTFGLNRGILASQNP